MRAGYVRAGARPWRSVLATADWPPPAPAATGRPGAAWRPRADTAAWLSLPSGWLRVPTGIPSRA